MVSDTSKGFTIRSKLAYGKTISTVGPPNFKSPIRNVKLKPFAVRLLCKSSSIKYNPDELSRANPSSFSNA